MQEESDKKGSFKIHQVIRMSLSSQIKKLESDYTQLIDRLYELVINKENKKICQLDLIIHLAEIFPFQENAKHIELLQKSVELYCTMSEFEKAVECGEFLERYNLMNSEVYFYRGCVFYTSADYQKAVEDLTESIKLDLKSVLIYFLRGDAYFELKEHKKAIEDFTRLIESYPKIATFYNNRGNIFFDLKDYPKA
ncbi:MAG TPA: tetratricopeptide repeat protein, partial [Leptospiraceae bacterium]|nr:tetratricopeptide repeat protein [Leptospiraceae bacterium]